MCETLKISVWRSKRLHLSSVPGPAFLKAMCMVWPRETKFFQMKGKVWNNGGRQGILGENPYNRVLT